MLLISRNKIHNSHNFNYILFVCVHAYMRTCVHAPPSYTMYIVYATWVSVCAHVRVIVCACVVLYLHVCVCVCMCVYVYVMHVHVSM